MATPLSNSDQNKLILFSAVEGLGVLGDYHQWCLSVPRFARWHDSHVFESLTTSCWRGLPYKVPPPYMAVILSQAACSALQQLKPKIIIQFISRLSKGVRAIEL